MQIITVLFLFTVQKYIFPPVSKVHAGYFHVAVIHQTLSWNTGFLWGDGVAQLVERWTQDP